MSRLVAGGSLPTTGPDPRDVVLLRTLVTGCPDEIVVARYPSEWTWVAAELARSGRVVLPAGTLVHWEIEVDRAAAPAAVPTVDVVPADASSPGSADRLGAERLVGELVAATFDGYPNHYAFNPLIDPAAALAGYVEWAQSCLGGQDRSVLVLRVAGAPAGIATLALDRAGAEILLAGVLPAYQGRGLYATLLSAVVATVVARGGRSVRISTQAHNTKVQRAWSRFGFEPVGAVDTVHLLLPGLLEQRG